MNQLDANIAPSFADPSNPHAVMTRLKKRVDSVGKQLRRLTPAMKACEDQAVRAVAEMAYANWLTAKGLTDAAEALSNRRPVDMLLGGNQVEIEIAEVSMKDVRALTALQGKIKTSAPGYSNDEPEVTLGGKGRFGCIAPDPESWFNNTANAEDKPQTCALPSLTVVISVDFANRNASVQDLMRLAEASLVEAERELGETRARLCHSEDGSCQLF
ncbi:MAG: hypothetical protein SFV17_15490 [Candidatus Obscuribacter sp.]|nr:hypothetical protein [Candidatus Melainabacteria bacterium]MDX1988086.1 hypothetical protein [Candidatus Obscuribacter sp.]